MRLSDEVHADRNHREAHRRLRVVPRIIAGRQHLHEHVGGQADREGGERPAASDACRSAVKCAVLEQAADDRLGRKDEGDRRRQGQEQRELDAAVLRVHRLGVVAGRLSWRETVGSRMVPRPMPIRPSGSWFSRSA